MKGNPDAFRPLPIRFAADLPGSSASLTAWFAETDREVPLEGRPAGGATRFELALPPYGAAIVIRTRSSLRSLRMLLGKTRQG